MRNGRSEEIFFRRVAQDFVDKSDEANRYCARVLNCRGFQRGKKRENHAKKNEDCSNSDSCAHHSSCRLRVSTFGLSSAPLQPPRHLVSCSSQPPSRRTVFNDSIPRCASCQRRTYAKVGCSHQKKFKKRVRTAKKTKQNKKGNEKSLYPFISARLSSMQTRPDTRLPLPFSPSPICIPLTT